MLTSTRKLLPVSIFALCVGALLAAAPARADLKIASKMSMDSPMMKNMPAQAKAQMANMMQMTTYVSGKKVCVSNPMYSLVIDQDAKTMVSISPMSKAYTEMPYNPAMAQSMMSGPMGGMSGAMQDLHIEEDTTNPTTILGHKVRHYITTGHMTVQGMGDVSMHTDSYYAQDLPAADMAAYGALSAGTPGGTQTQGIPLKIVSSMTGGPMGSMTITMEATSISTDPVPASVFDIPKGYKKQDMPNTPGMGGAGPGAPPSQ